MAVNSGFILRRAKQDLSEHREGLRELLQHWQPFNQVDGLISDYVSLLNLTDAKIHQSKSDVLEDVGILEDLLPNLERELAEAKKKNLPEQLSSVYAHMKNSMMLCELQSILREKRNIPDEFRKWINLQLSDTEGIDNLESTYAKEKELFRKAKAYGVPLEKQTITIEPFEFDNPDLVKNRIKEFRKEFSEVITKTAENSSARTRIPQICESVKKLMVVLQNRCSQMSDDAIVEE